MKLWSERVALSSATFCVMSSQARLVFFNNFYVSGHTRVRFMFNHFYYLNCSVDEYAHSLEVWLAFLDIKTQMTAFVLGLRNFHQRLLLNKLCYFHQFLQITPRRACRRSLLLQHVTESIPVSRQSLPVTCFCNFYSPFRATLICQQRATPRYSRHTDLEDFT